MKGRYSCEDGYILRDVINYFNKKWKEHGKWNSRISESAGRNIKEIISIKKAQATIDVFSV